MVCHQFVSQIDFGAFGFGGIGHWPFLYDNLTITRQDRWSVNLQLRPLPPTNQLNPVNI